MNGGVERKAKRVVIAATVFAVAVLMAQFVSAYFLQPRAVMHLAGERFEVRIADNDRTRIKGLSGTSELPANEAMVFIFDNDSRHTIWMKDMNYSIDIVWLDASRTVVDYVTDVSPDTYPNRTFSPKADARYVAEFRSGTVQAKGIRVGQQAVFSGTSRNI